MSDSGRELESFPVIYGAHLNARDGQKVKPGDQLATWIRLRLRLSPKSTVRLSSAYRARTYHAEKVDPVTGKSAR